MAAGGGADNEDGDQRALIELVRSAVVERSPDLIAAFARTGELLWINDAGLERLGYQRAEVVGSAFAEYLHPEDAERAMALALSEVDHLRGAHDGAPYRLRCADGRYEIFDVQVTVLDEMLVAVGRRMRDHDLTDRVLEALSSGGSFESVVALLPDFDLWRNPTARCIIRTSQDDGTPLVVGSPLPAALSGANAAPGSPWQVALAEGREVVDPDCGTLDPTLRAQVRAEGLRGCRVIAVDDPRGHDPALVTVFAAEDASPIEAHRYPLETIANTLRLLLQIHHDSTRLKHAATHDALTDVLHRGGFFGMLPDDLGSTPTTVLAVDLDGFKAVNDRLGHAAGDVVLCQVAERLRQVVGPEPIVARLGGDEFVVVLVGTDDAAAAEELAGRIGEAVAHPIACIGGPVAVTASIGVVVDGGSGRTMDDLLAEADQGMYRSKARTRRQQR